MKSVLVFLVAFCVLLLSAPEPRLCSDSIRDQAVAEASDALSWLAVPASIGGLSHGGVWYYFLRVARAVGLEAEGQYVVMTGLGALAAGLLYQLVKTRLHPRLAWPAASAFIFWTTVCGQRPMMGNPALGSVFCMLFYYAMVELVCTGSLVAAALSGAFLGLASAAHVSNLALMPLPIFLAVLFCRRPVAGAALVALATAGVLVVDSPQSVFSNLSFLQRSAGHAAAALALGVLVLGVTARFRESCLAFVGDRRAAWVMILAAICYPCFLVAASMTLDFPLDPGARLWLPIIVPLSLLLALAIDRLGRRIQAAGGPFPSALTAGLPVIFLVLTFVTGWLMTPQGRVLRPVFSLRDVNVLATHLARSGRPVHDIRHQLRGPGSDRLARALVPWDRGPSSAPLHFKSDLRVLLVRRGEDPPSGVPTDTETISLGFGKTLWLLPIESWVRAAPDRVCTESTDGSFATSCVDEATSPPSDLTALGERAAREYTRLHGDVDSHVRFLFELPVQIHGNDNERTLELVEFNDQWQGDDDWRIDRIDGIGFRGSLPAHGVAITRDGALTGHVVVSVSFSNWGFLTSIRSFARLDVIETRPTEHLLQELTQRR